MLDTGRGLFRGAGGGGIAEVLDPKEERFVCNFGRPTGPVDRLSPSPEEWPFELPARVGRKVGVDGREVGVCTVLDVVAELPIDSLDCGRFIPPAVLCDNPVLFSLNVGEAEDADALGRKEVDREGLDSRRRSLSVSLRGGGESSIMRTHPDESPGLSFFFSLSMSMLRLDSELRRFKGSQLVLPMIDLLGPDEVGVPLPLGIGALALIRFVTLPIRSRGTRE